MDTYLEHHGILGQKWGVRRYQNKNGSLTLAGEKRYYGIKDKSNRFTSDDAIALAKIAAKAYKTSKSVNNSQNNKEANSTSSDKKGLSEGQKKALIAVATGLAAYGAYKYVDITKEKAYQLTMAKGEKAIDSILSNMKKVPVSKFNDPLFNSNNSKFLGNSPKIDKFYDSMMADIRKYR